MIVRSSWELDYVETILGDVTDPKLPKGELDLIFIISSYHHFSDPIACMRNARPALKPDGFLTIVEWLPRDGSDTGEGSPKQIEAQLKAAGYKLERTDPLLRANRLIICIFRPDTEWNIGERYEMACKRFDCLIVQPAKRNAMR